jgi:formylglycine-generating enzyme required for sulfatase activity
MNTPSTSEQAAVAEVEQNLFVTVPETTLPCVIVGGVVTRPAITVPAFLVGQYFCSQDADGKAAVTPGGQPWTDIDYHGARKACADAGFALLTETQALAIAFNVFQQDANWTGGAVGEGDLIQGLRLDRDDVDQAFPGDHVPADDERRMFVLSNGMPICDAAGNLFSWIFDDVQGDEHGLVAQAFAADSPSITTAPYPSLKRGMGWRPKAGADWSGHALIRGGCWCSESYAGVFRLHSGWPDYAYGDVGFRCTKPIGL